MKKRSHIFRGFAGITLAFAVFTVMVMSVAMSWRGRVNELLGVTTSAFELSRNPEDYYFQSDYDNPADLIAAEIALNTRLEAEGAVVMKGMPAIEGTNVTVFGMRSQAMQYGGTMGSLIEGSQAVRLADAMTEYGFSVNPELISFYEEKLTEYKPGRAASGNCVDTNEGATINEVPAREYLSLSTDTMQQYADAAVVVLGRDAGEGASFYPGEEGIANPDEFTDSPTGNILSLSDDERSMINFVKNQGFKKIIILLNSACAMEVEELKTDEAIDCIMWIGNPGCYGTYGIAKLLNGSALPSGHLPDTYAVDSSLAPGVRDYGAYVFENADQIETTTTDALRASWYLVEEESIYIGYKYYETRYFDSIVGQGNAATALTQEAVGGSATWDYDKEVSYPFGYGVEGSTFTEEIVGSEIDWTGETPSTVTVKVTNIGNTAAKHVVQLYISQPYTEYDRENGIEKSAIQLVGYAKTGEASEETFEDEVLLGAGESEEVTVTFKATDFYSYDKSYAHDGVIGAYLLEAGDYYFATGNGAHDAVQSVLVAMYPELMEGIIPTGMVFMEHVSEEIALTESNGVLIQNRLEDGDLNAYDCGTTVTMLTRKDWAGTFPTGIDSITATPEMITLLQNNIYDKEAENDAYTGETEFVYEKNSNVKAIDLKGLDYDDPLYEETLEAMSLQDILNVYCAWIDPNETLQISNEKGADSPLGILFTIGKYTAGTIYEVSEEDPSFGHATNVYVSENVVAATFSPLLVEEEGRLIGNDALWTGCNEWNAPGLNIHRNQYNARNLEYYSEDSILTGNMGAAIYRQVVSYGVVAAGKHFAFNDQETNRDGVAVFIDEQAARENELRGFQIALRDGNANSLMTAFNRLGCTHVAASKELMNGIVRGEWGFNGYIITDSVKSAQYFIASDCAVAGNDRMLGGSNNGEVWGYTADKISEDPVLESLARESYHRYLYAYVNSNIMNGITANSANTNAVTWWILALQLTIGAFTVAFAAFFGLFVLAYRKERVAIK